MSEWPSHEEPAAYDRIADDYDRLFDSPEANAENVEVVRRLAYKGESVLDVGCGTGMLLRYLDPIRYLGIDPSARMLERFQGQWNRRWAQTTFEMFLRMAQGERFGLVVALYGVASYINPHALQCVPRLLEEGGRYFFMFYRDEYDPVTHKKTGVNPHIYRGSMNLLRGHRTIFGNYTIIEGPYSWDTTP